mgnify:CR=1 FL=1
MAKKIVIEKELLVKLYINEGRSIRKISNELGYTTLSKWLGMIAKIGAFVSRHACTSEME